MPNYCVCFRKDHLREKVIFSGLLFMMCCTMAPWKEMTCHRKAIFACAFTALVLFAGLMILVPVHKKWIRDKIDTKNQTEDTGVADDCNFPLTVVTDSASRHISSSTTSATWSRAELKARLPAHKYLERRHTVAIHEYMLLLTDGDEPKDSMKINETLYFCLSEAVQILKHDQVSCLRTQHRTETHLEITSPYVRFSSFILGSAQESISRSASCFEIYSCFGADVSQYAGMQPPGLLLVPPYEVFQVTGVKRNTPQCQVVYTLKSSLNCVYDRNSNTLQAISVSPMHVVWCISIITCILIFISALIFVLFKVLKCKQRDSLFGRSAYHPPAVAM
ncbi:uncharacterized protein ACB058_014304 [Synchiropus picturatus]